MRFAKRVFVTVLFLAQFFCISPNLFSSVLAGCEVEPTSTQAINQETNQIEEGPTPPYPYYNNNYNNGYNNGYNNDCNNDFNNEYNNEYNNGYNNGYVGGIEAATPTDEPIQNSDPQDPCKPGNSYIGPYCGWSPGIVEYKHDPENSVALAQAVIDPGNSDPRIGGVIFGLSDTSSEKSTGLANLLFLIGSICLFAYIAPKLLEKDDPSE